MLIMLPVGEKDEWLFSGHGNQPSAIRGQPPPQRRGLAGTAMCKNFGSGAKLFSLKRPKAAPPGARRSDTLVGPPLHDAEMPIAWHS
jgi:hypothetical protein